MLARASNGPNHLGFCALQWRRPLLAGSDTSGTSSPSSRRLHGRSFRRRRQRSCKAAWRRCTRCWPMVCRGALYTTPNNNPSNPSMDWPKTVVKLPPNHDRWRRGDEVDQGAWGGRRARDRRRRAAGHVRWSLAVSVFSCRVSDMWCGCARCLCAGHPRGWRTDTSRWCSSRARRSRPIAHRQEALQPVARAVCEEAASPQWCGQLDCACTGSNQRCKDILIQQFTNGQRNCGQSTSQRGGRHHRHHTTHQTVTDTITR